MISKTFNPQQWSIANFKVGRRLGNGKYGDVYLVKQRRTDLILAIKCLSKNKILKYDVIKQIRRQIQIQSHLDHQNILQMYGYFYDQKNIYIMMEYATQGELYALLKKQKTFDEPTVKMFMKQMVRAVDYLQDLNIIHRDIKPQNILVTGKGQLKLSDYGWAIKTTNTRRITFCGTPDYFSPQIVKQKPFDRKVDNWCLGILAYELLCGNTPFYSQSPKQMYKRIEYSQIRFPRYASKLFIDFVSKLLKKDAKERMELKDALKHPWLADAMQVQEKI